MNKRFVYLVFLFVATFPIGAFAQLEVSGGYTHLSGNFGLDGLHAGVGLHTNRWITLVGESDFVWDTSHVGVFDLSPNAAAFRIKSNEQNYLGGARVRVIGWKPMKVLEKRKILPFVEFLMGVSRLNQKVTANSAVIGDLDSTDQAFTWVLGAGVDYTLNRKWLARGTVDFVRTHFVDSGQSRVRLHAGISYIF